MIFAEIKALIERNRSVAAYNRKGRKIYAEDVIPCLAKARNQSAEEVEAELRFVLNYAGGFCVNVRGLTVMDFLVRECQFSHRPKSHAQDYQYKQEEPRQQVG